MLALSVFLQFHGRLQKVGLLSGDTGEEDEVPSMNVIYFQLTWNWPYLLQLPISLWAMSADYSEMLGTDQSKCLYLIK